MSPTVKAQRPTPAAAAAKRKNPLVAVGLSFALPGGGQFYLGAWAKGAGFLAVALAMVAYVIYISVMASVSGDPELIVEAMAAQAGTLGFLAGIAFPALMIASMADAWFHAKRLETSR